MKGEILIAQTRFLTGPLCLFDVALGVVAVLFPHTYLQLFHPRAPVETTGLLGRAGIFWLGYAVVQGLAFFSYKWLPESVLVVGVLRLIEVPADLVYVSHGSGFGYFGHAALVVCPAFNLLAGSWLLRCFFHFRTLQRFR